MSDTNTHNANNNLLIVALMLMPDMRVPYTCGIGIRLWKNAHNGQEAWTYSYHDCWGVEHTDYEKTLEYYPTADAAMERMANFVYNMNRTLFGKGL